LDARVDREHLTGNSDASDRVSDWLNRCGRYLDLPRAGIDQIKGAIFEVRQGYKSADAKRQNADLRFGLNAVASDYLPIVAIVSTQASRTVLRRYKNAKMLVMTGVLSEDDRVSTYAFFKKIVGYELAEFFKRNTTTMRERCQRVLAGLLTPE